VVVDDQVTIEGACEVIASRIRTHDDHTLHVLVFEAEDLPGTWVAHILDCDVVTQGTSPGDAIDMALDAWDCVPPEGRDRLAPVEDWRRWVFADVRGVLQSPPWRVGCER
jgi:hypothetical protein